MSPTRRCARRATLTVLLPLAAMAAACADGAREGEAQEAAEGEEAYVERMAREHAGETPVPAGAGAGTPARPVTGDPVAYAVVDGDTVRGYLALPEDGAASAPGVIVIHEWWGLNDNIRAMARRLAGEGYAALAVDLYAGDVATTSDGAMELVRQVDGTEARENLRQAYGFLIHRGAPRVGVIGWCFGGGWSLQTALLLPSELDAAVIYYGRLTADPEELASLELPVQGHFGAEDGSIPVAEVRRFESVLDSLGVDGEVYVYEGAGHAFANPSGERYVPGAAERAWERTVSFLGRALQEDGP